MKMKKILFTVLLAVAAITLLQAETVYLDELQKAADSDSIVFENYSGPHNRIDTAADIRGIGTFLGSRIGETAGSFSYFGKYSVIHAVDPTDPEGLDADIFILEPTAAVDHIKNLRRIIAGFLEEAYDYETEQADLLAEFITVYNAVHRTDTDYFGNTYKRVVTRALSPEKAGLALSYKEWPGKTMILIPLTPQAGSDVLGDLETDILSDEDVIKQLQTEEDMGIEKRQALVDLKDQEVAEQREDIAAEREQIREREDSLTETKQELSREAEQLEAEQTDQAVQRKAEIQDEIDQIEQEQQTIDEDKSRLDEQEKAVETREEKIVQEREQIARDQMKLIDSEDKTEATAVGTAAVQAPTVKTVPFLKISGSEGSYTGRLLLIDSAKGSIVKQSETDSIRLRGYHYDGKVIISVAGSSGGNRIVSIVMIDPQTLEVLNSGTEEVYTDSAIVESSGKYYAIVKDGSNWKVGIFDKTLNLESVSPAAVFPASDIVVSSGDVIVQDQSGRIVKIGSGDFTSPSP